jgi:hypothetical protein
MATDKVGVPPAKHLGRVSTFDRASRRAAARGRLAAAAACRAIGGALRRATCHGSPNGLDPKTVLEVHVVLRKALADARRRCLVIHNVAEDAEALKRRRPNAVLRAWNAEQLQTFLDRAARTSHPCGGRQPIGREQTLTPGHSLRWGDIDLDAGRLSISRALVSVGYVLHESRARHAPLAERRPRSPHGRGAARLENPSGETSPTVRSASTTSSLPPRAASRSTGQLLKVLRANRGICRRTPATPPRSSAHARHAVAK